MAAGGAYPLTKRTAYIFVQDLLRYFHSLTCPHVAVPDCSSVKLDHERYCRAMFPATGGSSGPLTARNGEA